MPNAAGSSTVVADCPEEPRQQLTVLFPPCCVLYCCTAVVRYDLEYLGLCPCMVDVEIIDAKNDNQSIFVSAGPEACICSSKVGGSQQFPTNRVPKRWPPGVWLE